MGVQIRRAALYSAGVGGFGTAGYYTMGVGRYNEATAPTLEVLSWTLYFGTAESDLPTGKYYVAFFPASGGAALFFSNISTPLDTRSPAATADNRLSTGSGVAAADPGAITSLWEAYEVSPMVSPTLRRVYAPGRAPRGKVLTWSVEVPGGTDTSASSKASIAVMYREVVGPT